MVVDDTVDLRDLVLAHRLVLPRRVVRAVRAVPRRHRPPGGSAAPHAPRRARSAASRDGARAARRGRRGDAGRVDLRPRPDRVRGDRIGDQTAAPVRRRRSRRDECRRSPCVPIGPPAARRAPAVALTIDGRAVSVPEGTTILSACASIGIDDSDALLPRDAEAGQRLPPLRRRGRRGAGAGAELFARRSRPGMIVRTRSPRVMLARKLVLELLARRSISRRRRAWRDCWTEYRLPARSASVPAAGHRRAAGRRSTTTSTCATTASACSATSASRPAGPITRTRSRSRSPAADSARASPPSSTSPLPDSACVYCGNCIAVCPTGALMASREYDLRQQRRVGRVAPDHHRYHLPVLRRRLHAHAARAGRRDRQGDLAARQPDHRGQPVHQGPVRLALRVEPRLERRRPAT